MPPSPAAFPDLYRNDFPVDSHARAPAAVGVERMPDRPRRERAVGHRRTLSDSPGITRKKAGQCLHDSGPDFLKRLHPDSLVTHADGVAPHRYRPPWTDIAT